MLCLNGRTTANVFQAGKMLISFNSITTKTCICKALNSFFSVLSHRLNLTSPLKVDWTGSILSPLYNRENRNSKLPCDLLEILLHMARHPTVCSEKPSLHGSQSHSRFPATTPTTADSCPFITRVLPLSLSF